MSNRVAVFRKEHFNAAHRIFNPAWEDSKNFEVFGKCSNPNYHGHNYELIIKVTGEPDPETGYVIDLKRLSTIVDSEILDHVDHKNLNLDVPFLKDMIPTAENIAVAFWNILAPKIPCGKLHCVKVYESDSNFVEYYGE